MSMSKGATVIRRGRADDVEPILDLLAHYERPRSYFEPFYLKEPTYRPETMFSAATSPYSTCTSARTPQRAGACVHLNLDLS